MPQKATKNIFAGGVDKDSHPKYIESNKLTSAINVLLNDDGNMHSPVNMKETSTKVVVDAGIEYYSNEDFKVLGTAKVKGKWTDDSYVDMAIIWTLSTYYSGPAYAIFAVELDGFDSIKIYEDTGIDKTAFDEANSYITHATITENAVDTVLFSDAYNFPMKLVCDFSSTSPYGATRSIEELKMQRHAAPGQISTALDTNGTLLSGSYIFYFRLFNPDANIFTAWSPASGIIDIATGDDASPVGSITGYGLTLYATIKNSSVSGMFSHVQWAVVPITSGEVVLPSTGYTLPIETFSGGLISTSFYQNEYESQIAVSELVTEQAALSTVNALQIKESRVFAGGITYASLEYDKGDPTVTGSIQSSTTPKANAPTTAKRGYFRDEVYRFYVSFYDENGNYSRPKVLDLNGITDNQISGSIKDLKFPPRNADGAYTILNSSNNPKTLFLRIASLTNIPTWAKGFTILRAKRKKNVLFQTPMLPGMRLLPAGAVGDYPQQAYGESSADSTRQIISTEGVYVTKNMLYPLHKNYVHASTKETIIFPHGVVAYPFCLWYVFPPSYLYTQNGLSALDQYTFNNKQSVEIVDLAALRIQSHDVHSTPPASENEGEYVDTKVAATLHATAANDYYYHPSDSTKAALSETSATIKDYVQLTEGSKSGQLLTGTASGIYTPQIETHDQIGVNGLVEGTPPNNQKMGAIVIDDSATWNDAVSKIFNYDVANTAEIEKTYYDAIRGDSRSTWAGINYTKVSSATTWAASYLTQNNLFSLAGTYTANDYIQAVYIANITAGLGDDRYGPDDSYHELIPIRTISFSSANYSNIEAGTYTYSTNLDLYDGDCYIAPHTFKVHDTVYSIANPDGTVSSGSASADTWGHSFDNGSAKEVRRPIPLKGAAAAITVFLESEINPFCADRTNYNSVVSGTSGINTAFEATGEADVRLPLDYNYNQAFSMENTLKAFIPYSSVDKVVTEYPARLHFSNQRLQSTSIEGYDIWSAGDYYDMEESHGAINALPKARDNMYAFQDSALSYIPIGEKVLEQATGANISVRTGSVVNTPLYISTKIGTQDPKSIAISENESIFFMDRRNKKIISLVGQEYNIISNKGMTTEFNSILADSVLNTYPYAVDKADIIGFYNTARQEYWIGAKFPSSGASNRFLWVWDERNQRWNGKLPHMSNYTTGDRLLDYVMYNNKIYAIGTEGDEEGISPQTNSKLNFYELYGGSTYHQGEITFIVNPDVDFVKVFDNLIYSSTGASGGKVDSIVLKTYRDSGLPLQTQSVSQSLVSTNTIEDIHKLKILRDSNDARLRGTYLEVTVKWDGSTVDELIPLSSVITKYRPSKRID